jgi:hypothetical protein
LKKNCPDESPALRIFVILFSGAFLLWILLTLPNLIVIGNYLGALVISLLGLLASLSISERL